MHKLDFIVFGLARSGTTALTNLIRANRRLFCGAEFFTPVADHSKINVPQAFFDEEARLEAAGAVPQHIRVSMEILRDRADNEIALYGNKWPLYSHFFERIMSETEAPQSIMTFRNYRACARSYDRRSRNPADDWHPGRRALFAGIEMMHVAKSLAKTRHTNMLIVPQMYMARDWRGALTDISDYLLPGEAMEVDDAVVARLEKSRAISHARKPVPLTPNDQTIFRLLDKAGLPDIFPTTKCVRLGDIQDALSKAVAALPEDHIGFCHQMALDFGEPEVAEYFDIWQRIATRT